MSKPTFDTLTKLDDTVHPQRGSSLEFLLDEGWGATAHAGCA